MADRLFYLPPDFTELSVTVLLLLLQPSRTDEYDDDDDCVSIPIISRLLF